MIDKHKDYRIAWKGFIDEKIIRSGKDAHHLVVASNYCEPLKRTSSDLSYLVRSLNRKLYGRNYKRNNHHLDGFAFLESNYGWSTHFHLLFQDDDAFHVEGKPTLEEHLFNIIEKRNESTGKYKIDSIDRKRVKLIQVYSKDITGYVTKTMRKCNSDFIGLLDADGVIKVWE